MLQLFNQDRYEKEPEGHPSNWWQQDIQAAIDQMEKDLNGGTDAVGHWPTLFRFILRDTARDRLKNALSIGSLEIEENRKKYYQLRAQAEELMGMANDDFFGIKEPAKELFNRAQH